jgi:hypothetical protein
MAPARKKEKKCGASSGYITNLKQSFFTFDIYGWKGSLYLVYVGGSISVTLIKGSFTCLTYFSLSCRVFVKKEKEMQ